MHYSFWWSTETIHHMVLPLITIKKRPYPRRGWTPSWLAKPGSKGLLCLCMSLSPIKALMNLNKAVCQFFRIYPEFRLLWLSPNKFYALRLYIFIIMKKNYKPSKFFFQRIVQFFSRQERTNQKMESSCCV